jgi:hypothetical protein
MIRERASMLRYTYIACLVFFGHNPTHHEGHWAWNFHPYIYVTIMTVLAFISMYSFYSTIDLFRYTKILQTEYTGTYCTKHANAFFVYRVPFSSRYTRKCNLCHPLKGITSVSALILKKEQTPSIIICDFLNQIWLKSKSKCDKK